MKRVVIPEWLDSDAGTPEEIAASLTDLNSINRRFGGISTTHALIAEVSRRTALRTISLLEVAAGTGSVPEAVAGNLRQSGVDLTVTLLDRAASHLRNGNGRSVAADASSLPFSDNSFDLVSSNLFLHHLEPGEIVRFLDEGLRVCRIAVLVNDLVRSRLHLSFVYAGLPLFHCRLTRHDAPASVRRAYTVEEMRAMAEKSNAARTDLMRHFLFRFGAICWKQDPPK